MNLKIGLLLLYIELYDKTVPEMRTRIEDFSNIIEKEFKKRDVTVVKSKICRVADEFRNAIKLFESKNVDAIVTLHLAYSPSLESVDILSCTTIPLIVLDTTPEYEFGKDVDPEEILYNHAIHGVQDFCSMLKQKGKDFFIEAGHWKKSDVIERVIKKVKASYLAKKMSAMRIGSIEGPFKSMGDFYVDPETLRETIGIETISVLSKDLSNLIPDADDVEVKKEIEDDKKYFDTGKLSSSTHLDTARIGIAVRRWIKNQNLGGFTMNFTRIGKDSGFQTLPFLEAGKAMVRGLGYAGEGDVLTAALVGTLLSVYPETSFVEMFCPDWKNNRIFLSHMGEVNISLISGKPRLIEKDIPFLDVGNPAIAVGQLKKGKAIYINLTPSMESYNLILSQVEIVEVNNSKMADTISGWFVPPISINDYLAEFSRLGGTHHSALVYNENEDVVSDFGQIMEWKVIKI